MDWINVVWLLVGLGLGLGIGWFWRTDQTGQTGASQATQHDTFRSIADQLKQTELAYRMASEMSQFKGGFLARTSHELRSPLNGLIGMHQLILTDLCDSPEEERDFIAQANESALKMVSILDSLIEVSKVEHGSIPLEIQPIQLAQLLEEVHTLTHLQAKNRNLRLHVSLPDPDIYIQADPRRLRQVLVKLIDAAIAELPEGEIWVSAQPVPEAGVAHIWVEDDRPAITPKGELLRTAWSEPIDRLQTAPEPQAPVPSPGLNLLVSQTLLALMQGRLEQQLGTATEGATSSESAHRTRIQCSLPLLVPESDE